MRSLLRKRLVLFITLMSVIFIVYHIRKTSNQLDIPPLKKSYVNKGKNILLGPFTSKTYRHHSEHSVTFATHTSMKNFYKLQTIMLVWKSPISVTIWAHGDLTRLVELIYMLTESCSGVHHLSISVLIPADQPHDVDVTSLDWHTILQPDSSVCGQRSLHNRFYQLRAADTKQNYNGNGVPYPNNRLRNYALRNVITAYSLTGDIDLLPSLNMDQLLADYIHGEPPGRKHALVIPVFESQQSQTSQWTVGRLIHQWQEGRVRQFYVETCPQCQGPTQYQNWIKKNSEAKMGDPITRTPLVYKPGWEPFVVLQTASHPKFDERFEQFGYNRMSMLCELHMTEFKFYALSHVFLVHDGFKTEEGFHADKDRELKRNEKLYLEFQQELIRRLGTSRRC